MNIWTNQIWRKNSETENDLELFSNGCGDVSHGKHGTRNAFFRGFRVFREK